MGPAEIRTLYLRFAQYTTGLTLNCTGNSVLCEVYCVQCSVHTVKCTDNRKQSAVYSVLCTLSSMPCRERGNGRGLPGTAAPGHEATLITKLSALFTVHIHKRKTVQPTLYTV